MSTLPKPKEPESLVADTAREALAKAKGSLSAAAKVFRRWIDNDDRLRRALTEPLIDSAIEVALGEILRQERGASWRAGFVQRPDRAASDRGLELLARNNLAGLLAFTLPGTYKPLGEATRAEVRAASAFYRAHRAGFQKRERWLTLVAAALHDDTKRVRAALSEEDLQNLQARAEREVEKEA